MAWNETSASAWGEIDLQIGVPASGNEMSESLATIGVVKENSISVDTDEGTKLQWFATGHKLVDELRLEPTMSIKVEVKNLNLANLQKFWDVEEDATSGKIKVSGMTTSAKLSVKMAPKVIGGETLEAPYCSVSMKPTYSEDSGWGQEVTFTILSPGTDKPLFQIGQVV